VREVTAADVPHLATGAWVLGTGGGGDPRLAQLNLERDLADGGTIALVDAADLDDDARVAVVSTMGAPLVGQERLVDPDHLVRAVRAMETATGLPFDAVMAVEIGGGNALAPFLVAARTGLPVVDADAMGRAFPEQQMTSFSIGGLSPAPLAVVDARANEVVVAEAASWRWMERISRAICTELGSVAATCKCPRTGREVKDWAITGTVTAALAIGRALDEAVRAHRDPVAAVVDHCGGLVLHEGIVRDVDRATTGGFTRGRASIDGAGSPTRCQAPRGPGTSTMTLAFQNEWTMASVDGVAVCTTPDLICLLDRDAGHAIGTETVRFGQRVAVVALPPPAVLCTERGLELVGPRAFGHDVDHRSAFAAPAVAS
jgi:uncharacterized protein